MANQPIVLKRRQTPWEKKMRRLEQPTTKANKKQPPCEIPATTTKNKNNSHHKMSARKRKKNGHNNNDDESNGHTNKMVMIHTQTWQAALILILAMGTSIYWNRRYGNDDRRYNDDAESSLLSTFWQYHCHLAQCHNAIRPVGRSHVAVAEIPAQTVLAEIPRAELITVSDARRALTSIAGGGDENDDEDDGAFVLARYLAQLMFHQQDDADHHLHDQTTMTMGRQSYLAVLPRAFDDDHPVVWNDTHLDTTLGRHSLTRHRVDKWRRTFDREYQRYRRLGGAQNNATMPVVSYPEYLVARLNVLTRSFVYHDNDGPEQQHAMVPILDLYHHRGRPNVSFRVVDGHYYQIRAARSIAKGEVLYDSYGVRTDSDLYAKYGFVNRDGDDWMDASLAVYHNPLDDIKDERDGLAPPDQQQQQQRRRKHQQQQVQLLQYLQFDDGYDHCIYPPNSSSWQFKHQKWRDLVHIAYVEKRWVVRHPPRSQLARQGLDAQGVFDTCQILTRTEYDDRHNDDAVIKVRTALCVVRLADLARQRLSSTSSSAVAADAIQSELETLQAVRIAALRSIHGLDRSTAKMRTEPCPKEAVLPLLLLEDGDED
jgi:hypothetical protein